MFKVLKEYFCNQAGGWCSHSKAILLDNYGIVVWKVVLLGDDIKAVEDLCSGLWFSVVVF